MENGINTLTLVSWPQEHRWPWTQRKGKAFPGISFLLWKHTGMTVRISLVKASVLGGDESLWQGLE